MRGKKCKNAVHYVSLLLFIAAGHICPFPFFFNDAYYDKCTRTSPQEQGQGMNILETYYWCPSPFNVTYGSADYHGAAIFSNGGEVGICPDFAKPSGNSQIFVFHKKF